MKSKGKKEYQKRFNASILETEQLNLHWHAYTITAITALLVIFALWASKTSIDEVTIAEGKILPYRDVYGVQHHTGGRIKKIHVKNGQRVTEKTVLAELDSESIDDQITNLKLRRRHLKTKYQIFLKQFNAKRKLTAEGLNSRISMLDMQIEKADLEGKIAETNADLAMLRKSLKDNRIYAKASGIIFNLNLQAGQLIGAGQKFCDIVPEDSKLVAELDIPSTEIGHIDTGHELVIKINTYDYSKFGGVESRLSEIAPISSKREGGKFVFRGYAPLTKNYLNSPKGPLRIIPGMTIQAEIRTGSKTVAEYILKPLTSSANAALRER